MWFHVVMVYLTYAELNFTQFYHTSSTNLITSIEETTFSNYPPKFFSPWYLCFSKYLTFWAFSYLVIFFRSLDNRYSTYFLNLEDNLFILQRVWNLELIILAHNCTFTIQLNVSHWMTLLSICEKIMVDLEPCSTSKTNFGLFFFLTMVTH